MTALAQTGTRSPEPVSMLTFALTGVKVYQNSRIGMFTSGVNKGKVTKYTATSNLLYLGVAYLTGSRTPLDATSVDKQLQVVLADELRGAEWMPQGATPIAATQVGELAYFADDNSVVPASSDLAVAPAGRILQVKTLEVLVVPQTLEVGCLFPGVQVGPTGTYTANDYAPAQVVHGASYPTPVTAAASTVTLPAPATLPPGVEVEFFADGTQGHTVQYRDATGPVNLTAALTASKRHIAKFSTRKNIAGAVVWVCTGSAVAP